MMVFSTGAGGAMPEIGLVPFARVAMDVATVILPTYRSRFSKHQFTQPQLLAILCLMRYEDWTFREAEVRLREHAELRAALRLSSVPDYTTVYRFLRRLPDDTIESALGESVRRLRRSSRRGRQRAAVAVDGTGLSPHGVSTYFLRRIEQHGEKRYRHYLKWLVVVDGLHYDWSDPDRVVLTTTDSNTWGGASGHTYTFTRQHNGTTDIDVVVVREGKNLKGRVLGLVLGTIGRRVLEKAFENSVKAIEARNAAAKEGGASAARGASA
jgi:Transposase domain (DUF772)